jgi:hypothetical protein
MGLRLGDHLRSSSEIKKRLTLYSPDLERNGKWHSRLCSSLSREYSQWIHHSYRGYNTFFARHLALFRVEEWKSGRQSSNFSGMQNYDGRTSGKLHMCHYQCKHHGRHQRRSWSSCFQCSNYGSQALYGRQLAGGSYGRQLAGAHAQSLFGICLSSAHCWDAAVVGPLRIGLYLAQLLESEQGMVSFNLHTAPPPRVV